jgi:hypothetical protein
MKNLKKIIKISKSISIQVRPISQGEDTFWRLEFGPILMTLLKFMHMANKLFVEIIHVRIISDQFQILQRQIAFWVQLHTKSRKPGVLFEVQAAKTQKRSTLSKPKHLKKNIRQE